MNDSFVVMQVGVLPILDYLDKVIPNWNHLVSEVVCVVNVGKLFVFNEDLALKMGLVLKVHFVSLKDKLFCIVLLHYN
jgi:hypothetical protein